MKKVNWRTPAYCALFLALLSCGGEGSGPETDEGHGSDLGSVRSYLAEGREVQIAVAGAPREDGAAIPSFDPRATAGIKWNRSWKGAGKDSWLDLIAASCDIQARSVFGNTVDGGRPALTVPGTSTLEFDGKGIFSSTPTTDIALPAQDQNSPLGPWITKYSAKPYIAQALLLCTGQRILEIGQSLTPTVFRGREYKAPGASAVTPGLYDWIAAGYAEDEWPGSWRDHESLLSHSASAINRKWRLPALSNFKELFSIPPPPAAQTATWSLIAIDFLRESAMIGTHALSGYAAGNLLPQLQGKAQLADGSIVTLEQMMLGNISDALMALVDASQRAERYVGASNAAAATKAEATKRQSDDPTPINVWRKRRNSRLEAARTFTAVSARSFEGHALIPLYRLENTTLSDIRETTDRSWVYAIWKATAGDQNVTESVLGYVFPPYLSPPVGAVPLYQYELKDASTGIVTEAVAATFAMSATLGGSYTAGAVEGYILPANETASTMTALRLVASAAPVKYTAEVGATGTVQGYLYRELVANNVATPSLSGEFPVVTELSQTNLDRMAEARIRATRVSPICLYGTPRCIENAGGVQLSAACLCGRTSYSTVAGPKYGDFNVDWVLSDLQKLDFVASDRTAWNPATGGSLDAYLEEQPFGGKNDVKNAKLRVKNAALRIIQEAAVLGRSIVPMAATSQREVVGVILVSGTQRDLREVEPVYLQARTDGAARLYGADVEATGEKLQGEFARRGMYHAMLFVRRGLAGYTPSMPLVATKTKLNAWLDEQAEGWVRFKFTRATSTANPPPSVFTIEFAERETVPTAGYYELWKGDAGLECALTGAVSGLNCLETDYRLGSASLPDASVAARRVVTAANTTIDGGTRVYATKNVGRRRRAMAGVTIPLLSAAAAAPAETAVMGMPIMSTALADAYARTLAADPSASYRANQYCGLIKYDTRVKLADEITRSQGSTGELSDSVEYYLKRAETAAARSDQLGEDIIESGLQMDLRSEQGQEQLEDLCGVTTDADPFSTNGSLTPTQGSSGLAACTVGADQLAWLSVGQRRHCVWRLNATTPPCDCGSNKDCQAAMRKSGAPQCPLLPASAVKETKKGGAAQCGAEYGTFFSSNSPAISVLYEATETLGYSVQQDTQGESPITDVPAIADRPEGFRDNKIVSRCDMLAALYLGKYDSSTDKTVNDIRSQLPWLDFDELRNVSASLGWSMDPYGRVTLLLDEEPWLKVGSFAPGQIPGVKRPYPTRDLSGVKDRREWAATEGATTTPWTFGWGCSRTGATSGITTAGLLACAGDQGYPLSASTCSESSCPGRGAINDAMTVYTALDTLALLTGAAGTRDGWIPMRDYGMFSSIAERKEKVSKTEPLSAPLSDLITAGSERYVYWANDDEDEYFVTHVSVPGKAGFFQQWFLPSPEAVRDPWNWQNAAAFRKFHSDRQMIEVWDADEFANDSTLWDVVRNWNGAAEHKVIETAGPWWEAVWSELWAGPGRTLSDGMTLTRDNLYDAFSLACMALDSRDGIRPSVAGCGNFFSDQPTLRDAANASDCVAGQLNNLLDTMYLPGVPQDLVQTLKSNQAQQVLPEYAGQYAEAASTLGAELSVYQGTTQATSRALNEISYQVRTVGRTIDKLENEADITEIGLRRDIANQVTACLVAISESTKLDDTIASGGANKLKVAATCANSAAQIVWATKIQDLQKENIDITEKQALDDFQENIQAILARVDDQIEELKRTQAAIHAAISKMDSIRRQAARAVTRATLATDAGQGRVNHVNAVMRARINTAQIRYERAFDQAVRYGFLGRRAIEERVGMELDIITKKSSLSGSDKGGGEAPYEWAEQICSMTGIDYDSVAAHEREKANADASPATTEPFSYDTADFAGSYVGDYVVRLRDFLDSYRFDYPFQDGADTVVVSVRDELQGIRRLDCPVDGWNLLLDAASPQSTNGFWMCSEPMSELRENCASFVSVPSDTGPFSCTVGGNCTVEERLVGVAALQSARMPAVAPSVDIARTIEQPVQLARGRHTFSWYERCDQANRAEVVPVYAAPGGAFVVPATSACACTNATSQAACSVKIVKTAAQGGGTWIRRSAVVDVLEDGESWIGFKLPVDSRVTAALNSPQVTALIAAPQLQRGDVIKGFFPTASSSQAPIGICEDSDGEHFRARDNWTYRCETYCPPGTGLDCTARFPADQLPKACYFETRFTISEDQIEAGRMLQEAGFSKGNFNYRVDSLGLNVVGTGVKNCTGAELSSGCYAGSFLQYSIEQVGPYRVRNHNGDLYPARLFTGRIQQAKALAAERYLTNPLSSADQGLMGDYMRSEFRGRPLDGTYLLRVYENDALHWARLEDVQMVIKYRYWTRLD